MKKVNQIKTTTNNKELLQTKNISGLKQNLDYPFYNADGKKTNNIFNSNSSSKGSMVQFDLPVVGHATISSDYGEDRGDYYHKGIDFDGKMGDDILSTANGKVAFAGKTENGGNSIVIQHAGGVMTKYLHLDSNNVEEGQFVKTGEKIGEMGKTGNSHSANGGDGSHLHFEVLEDGQNVDPDKYLNLREAEHKIGDYGGSESSWTSSDSGDYDLDITSFTDNTNSDYNIGTTSIVDNSDSDYNFSIANDTNNSEQTTSIFASNDDDSDNNTDSFLDIGNDSENEIDINLDTGLNNSSFNNSDFDTDLSLDNSSLSGSIGDNTDNSSESTSIFDLNEDNNSGSYDDYADSPLYIGNDSGNETSSSTDYNLDFGNSDSNNNFNLFDFSTDDPSSNITVDDVTNDSSEETGLFSFSDNNSNSDDGFWNTGDDTGDEVSRNFDSDFDTKFNNRYFDFWDVGSSSKDNDINETVEDVTSNNIEDNLENNNVENNRSENGETKEHSSHIPLFGTSFGYQTFQTQFNNYVVNKAANDTVNAAKDMVNDAKETVKNVTNAAEDGVIVGGVGAEVTTPGGDFNASLDIAHGGNGDTDMQATVAAPDPNKVSSGNYDVSVNGHIGGTTDTNNPDDLTGIGYSTTVDAGYVGHTKTEGINEVKSHSLSFNLDSSPDISAGSQISKTFSLDNDTENSNDNSTINSDNFYGPADPGIHFSDDVINDNSDDSNMSTSNADSSNTSSKDDGDWWSFW